MEVLHYVSGKAGKLDVDPSFLGDKVKVRTLKSAILMYEANKRVGTHNTLTRSQISRSKRALFRQKGLGRGRARHPQAPQHRGGGVAHGPHPRDYSYRLPRKALRVALQSALLSKFRDGEVAVIEDLRLEAPKTRAVYDVLKAVGAEESCLIVTAEHDRSLYLSARNIPRVKVSPVSDLNAYDVLFYRRMALTKEALEALREVHGGE